MKTKAKEAKIVHYTPKAESWRLSEVSNRGKTETYEIIGEMTPAKTQDKLIEKYGLEIPSTELLFGIMSRTYELRNKDKEVSETLRLFLRKGVRAYPNTSTRIVYDSNGNDKIIHNYGTSNNTIDTQVVGSDGWINKIPDKKVLESLLGTQDIAGINNISQWINGTDSYLWRLNSKPDKKLERVARFVAGGDGLGLDCGRDPLGEYPAFRVLKVD